MVENLYTVPETARYLHVCQNTIRKWADSGELECYRIGKRKDRRFSQEQIDKFLGGVK